MVSRDIKVKYSLWDVKSKYLVDSIDSIRLYKDNKIVLDDHIMYTFKINKMLRNITFEEYTIILLLSANYKYQQKDNPLYKNFVYKRIKNLSFVYKESLNNVALVKKPISYISINAINYKEINPIINQSRKGIKYSAKDIRFNSTDKINTISHKVDEKTNKKIYNNIYELENKMKIKLSYDYGNFLILKKGIISNKLSPLIHPNHSFILDSRLFNISEFYKYNMLLRESKNLLLSSYLIIGHVQMGSLLIYNNQHEDKKIYYLSNFYNKSFDILSSIAIVSSDFTSFLLELISIPKYIYNAAEIINNQGYIEMNSVQKEESIYNWENNYTIKQNV